MSLTLHLGGCLNGCSACVTAYHDLYGEKNCPDCGLAVSGVGCDKCLYSFPVDNMVYVDEGDLSYLLCFKCYDDETAEEEEEE